MPDQSTVLLARDVRRMRDAQRAYFTNRTSDNLQASIALERQVDQKVGDILDRPLFGDDEEKVR